MRALITYSSLWISTRKTSELTATHGETANEISDSTVLAIRLPSTGSTPVSSVNMHSSPRKGSWIWKNGNTTNR